MIRRLLACAVVSGVLGLLALLGAGPASAHAVRVATDPAPDTALAKGPPRVSATFNEELQTTFAAMTVVGPDGNLWSNSTAPQVQGAVVSVDLRALGPAGTYTVNYRVTSADGHVVSGAWSFRLTEAGSGSPGPPVSAGHAADGELPIWPFVAAAVVIIGAGAWWAARRST
jgi:copper resistance protein C